MRPPGFWQRDGVLPILLSPFSAVYAAATARLVARPGWRAPVPVICCGNAGVGGAGKTTLALDLGARLVARRRHVAFLTRGYGGAAAAPLRVQPDRDGSDVVGDEALLLAACAPTFVCPDRAAAARVAVAEGACALIMDDGLQHPGLAKDFSFLAIDGAAGFGNGRVLPAGPLREPVGAAAARSQAAVLVGEDRHGALAALPPGLPVLRASLAAEALPGGTLFAFAGIYRPEKFFETLEAAGARVVGRMRFADHHVFSATELQRVLAAAERLGAVPVTTPKDAMRLPAELRARVQVVGVRLVWEDTAALDALLEGVVA